MSETSNSITTESSQVITTKSGNTSFKSISLSKLEGISSHISDKIDESDRAKKHKHRHVCGETNLEFNNSDDGSVNSFEMRANEHIFAKKTAGGMFGITFMNCDSD